MLFEPPCGSVEASLQPALQIRAPLSLLLRESKIPETASESRFIAISALDGGYVRWTIWNGRVAKWGEVG